jgi:hypothetical protein
MLGARLPEAFIHSENPITREVWFSDPAYHWFREVFLEMARETDGETFNCTEGGLLFGPGITTVPLDAFLDATTPAARPTVRKDSHG